jgi:copper chaperone CopZ
VNLSLQIAPVGDTTAREISAVSQEVRDVLERLPGVTRVESQRVPAPDHAKGALVDALEGLALSVAPAVLKAVLQALQTVLSRQPPATKVLIQTKGGQVSFEFDPKKISLQQLVSAAERLGAAAPQA